jgi:chromosome segregation protein
VQTVLSQLPDEANETVWQTELEDIDKKLARLGSVNLAALDEYQTEYQRKVELDTQFNDLNEGVKLLTQAIDSIDQEIRGLLQKTLDTINQGFQGMFPRLFGGGEASLKLITQDILTSGITVMARPPGKKNSTIHLLSGGEKALTAVALVFAIFELNPAPFCLLDEVDAPLDDTNVGRFCKLVKEMSSQLQFIFISHNKIAMEIAEQLIGVTMQEAGVSRPVSVDIDLAVEMATVT